MKVICEKYKECTGCVCRYKTLTECNEKYYSKTNYCYHIEKYVDSLTEKEIRKQKIEKINESKM